jgi:hypothetical protein
MTARDRVSAPDWFGRATALLTTLAVGFLLLRPAPAALMQGDSQSYLGFAATRTAGYPLLLRLVEHLPGGLLDLPYLQLGLYGLAAWYFACAFRRLTGSNLAGVLLLVLLLGNGQVTRFSFMIMTESTFLSCLMLLLALFCQLARTPRLQTLALASLFAGLAVLVRPVGYALLASLPVAGLWSWRDALPTRMVISCAALPCLAALGFGMAAYYAEHGVWRTQSFLGSNLFGKAAAIVDARLPGPDADTIAWMAQTVAPDRAVIERSPTVFDRYRLLERYYDIWRQRTLYDPLPARTGTPKEDLAALDRTMLGLSLEVIRAAPGAYLADVALNYAALWCLPDAMTQAQLARFRAFLAALGPLPDLGQYPPWHQEHNDAVIWGLFGFMMTALASTFWWSWCGAMGTITHTPIPPLARFGFVAGLMVHACFLLTAAVQAGLPRYVWAMWPALSVLSVSGLLGVWQGVRGARSGTIERAKP